VPESFDYFCPLSMGWSPATIAGLEQNHKDLLLTLAHNKNIELLWISVGTLDPLVTNVQATLALFDKYGIEYIYAHSPTGAMSPMSGAIISTILRNSCSASTATTTAATATTTKG